MKRLRFELKYCEPNLEIRFGYEKITDKLIAIDILEEGHHIARIFLKHERPRYSKFKAMEIKKGEL